jgi:hypothetical protein
MRALVVNRIANLLHRAYGAPVAPLSVAEMSARGWAHRDGMVKARWNHAGAGRRVYDVQGPRLFLGERADLEAHAPPLPPPDLDAMFAAYDREHTQWLTAEGLIKYPAARAANVQMLAEVA